MPGLIASPLSGIHRGLGAKFAGFGGFEMPVEYAGVLAEHAAVRGAVGLFDVSHLGTFVVAGEGAAAYLNTRLSNDLDRLGPGQAQYTLLLTESGGVVDDMIVYRFGDDRVMVVPNAANSAAVIAQLRTGAPGGLAWTDRHTQDAILALQGPRSPEVMSKAGLPADLAYMAFSEAVAATPDGPVGVMVCRTGYTGERGYEIVVPAGAAPAIWERLMTSGGPYGIQPAGLGARDTLRTEMGYPLHGQDLSVEITPVQARLNWAVGWKKPAFDGASAVRSEREQGPARTLLGLKALTRAIPRPGMKVRDEGGEEIGRVTSGTFSPTLKQGIALALLPPGTQPGDQVLVEVRTRQEPFEVTKPPFVPAHV